MNWISPTELYNKLNLSLNRTACISNPRYMFVLDVRSQEAYSIGHILTAKRAIKSETKGWLMSGGLRELTYMQMVVIYDMSTTSPSTTITGQTGPFSELANYIWYLLHGSTNQSAIYLLNGGYEAFTELYPNCKSDQVTFTVAELSRLQVLPLHIPTENTDWGKLFYSPSETQSADRVAHVLSGIDAHVNCSLRRDPAFGLSPEEKTRVHYCILENGPGIDVSMMENNLKELHNVCLFIESHLREERNVMVFGEAGNSTAIAMLAAFVMKPLCRKEESVLTLDPDAAIHHISLCYPPVVVDETLKAILHSFFDKLQSDPDYRSESPFIWEEPGTSTKDFAGINSGNDLDEPNLPVSIVAGIMKSICPSERISKIFGTTEADGVHASSSKEALGYEKIPRDFPRPSSEAELSQLIASREEIRHLEEEIQWRVLYHDHIPQCYYTRGILRTSKTEGRVATPKRKSSLKASIVINEETVKAPSTVLSSDKIPEEKIKPERKSSTGYIDIHAATSDN